MLVPLRPMEFGEELTFDYFSGDSDNADTALDRCGDGYHKTRLAWEEMEKRIVLECGENTPEDKHKRYAFQGGHNEDCKYGFSFAQIC